MGVETRTYAELLRRIFDAVACGIHVRGRNGKVTHVNAAMLRLFDSTAEEMLSGQTTKFIKRTREDGSPLPENEMYSVVALRTGQPVRNQTLGLTLRDGTQKWAQVDSVPVFDRDGSVLQVVTSFIEITERRSAEEHVRRREREQAVVARLGQAALAGTELGDLYREAVGVVAQTLDVEYAKIMEILPGGREILMRASFGWREEAAGVETVPLADSHAEYALRLGQPVIIEELRTERRFKAPVLKRQGVVSGMNVIIAGTPSPYGVLSAHTTRPRHFSVDDLNFLQAVANVLSAAIQRLRGEEALRDSEARFRLLAENSTDLISRQTPAGVYRYVSPACRSLLGYAPEDLVGRSSEEFLHPDDVAELRARRAAMLDRASSATLVQRMRRKSGEYLWVETNFRAVPEPTSGTTIEIQASSRDITERRSAEEALEHQALHDPLTQLPNRVLLRDRLEQALLAAHRHNTSAALLLLDLDDFKEINDTFGHAAGDAVLCQIGPRLQARVRETDTVARLGGDEFAIVLTGVDETTAVRIAAELRAALEQPFVLGSQDLRVNASIGVALYPVHGDDAQKLLRCADVAMYQAKRSGGGHATYDAAQDPHTPDRVALAGELRRAILEGELTLHYQPLLTLRTGQVRLVEALVRWQHPSRGILLPGEFIPLAERTGLIKPLTEWVLAAAIRQCRAWHASGRAMPVSVNLSGWNLLDPALPDRIERLLADAGLNPGWLGLEVTESVLVADLGRASRTLERLREMGVRVAIDDFGVGYSSLGYVHQLPADAVKIDKSFVMRMSKSEESRAIVRAIIDLARSLRFGVVAEGVEDEAAWELLKSWGCNTAQGFWIARPMPPEALERWLDEHPQAEVASAELSRARVTREIEPLVTQPSERRFQQG